MDDFQIKPKKPREINRDLTDEGKRRLAEAGKKKKPGTGLAMRTKWQQLFMKKNPLREGEIYVRYTNPRRPSVQEVIVIASDVHQIEISRDGIEWKIAKRRNYHADKTR